MAGNFGIGDFNKSIYDFAQVFLDIGIHMWQVLPITTIGMGNSPYSGISLMAGNYLYIDPYQLLEEGLLTNKEIDAVKYYGDTYLVNYEHAKWAKTTLLHKAFSRFQMNDDIAKFIKDNKNWLEDYALYMSLRHDNSEECWSKWDKKYRFRDKDALSEYIRDNAEKIEYYYYEQYTFFKQWYKIKSDLNEWGIGIIGDIPIYPSYDSVDVWANTSEYQLHKKTLAMTAVAGVPPDYFSEEGQLWNNPLYNYKEMEKNGYNTFITRFKHLFAMYDVTRIDHFRGFYKYWSVPIESNSAKNGKWCKGPQMDLFCRIKNEQIIAEDLGIIDDEVREFLKATGYSGMKVMQFGFLDNDSVHLPHHYSENCVAYTGTHDNDTSLGWLYKLDEQTRNYILHYCSVDFQGWGAGGGSCPATLGMIKMLIASSARLAVIPFQDLCGYGSDTRMNVPAEAFGNWRFRATYNALAAINTSKIADMNSTYGRNRPFIKK